MTSRDLIIIGAGPAGSYLAGRVATRGLTPLVIEQRRTVGVPVQCAGIVSQKLLQLVDLPARLVRNRVRTARIVSPSGQFADMEGNERPVVIDRAGFDQWLAQRARDAGADVHLGEKFLGFERTGGGDVRVHTTRGTYEAPLLVGCDGPFSRVARACGVRLANIYGVQVRAPLPAHPADTATMYFGGKWRALFAWVVPEGDAAGTCRVGLGTARAPKAALDELTRRLGIAPGAIMDKQAGLIPVAYARPVAFPGVALLGDAAGHVKATTGGGIVMLLTAARQLARAVTTIHHAHGARYTREALEKHYVRPCKRSIGRQLKIHYVLRRLFARFTAADWDRILYLYKHTPVGQIFTLYGDMDFPRRFFFKLLQDGRVFRLLLSLLRRNWDLVGELGRVLLA